MVIWPRRPRRWQPSALLLAGLALLVMATPTSAQSPSWFNPPAETRIGTNAARQSLTLSPDPVTGQIAFTLPATAFSPRDNLNFTFIQANGAALPSWIGLNFASFTYSGVPQDDALSGLSGADDAPLAGRATVLGPARILTNPVVRTSATDADGVGATFDVALTVNAARNPLYAALISQDTKGFSGDGPSLRPALSRDGVTLLFESEAPNLSSDATATTRQIFFYRQTTGGLARLTNQAASGGIGAPSGGAALNPALSADGKWGAFSSDARDFSLPASDSVRQIYRVRTDRAPIAGTDGPPVAVSVSATGQRADGPCDNPALSGDGRFAVFDCASGNLVAGVSAAQRQVFRKDTVFGGIELVSVGTGGAAANQAASKPSISDDGRYVAFQSAASNLGSPAAAGVSQIWLRDMVAGTTRLISQTQFGVAGGRDSTTPRLSGDGVWAVFETDATELRGAAFVPVQIVAKNLRSGVISLVSRGTDLQPAALEARDPTISGDGRFVLFRSRANNLVANVTVSTDQIFVRDIIAGTTAIASADRAANPGNAAAVSGAIAGDGRIVAVATAATSIASRTRGQQQVILAANPLVGPVQTGWWWNPAEPGRAFAVEERGGALLMLVAGYGADGAPAWLSSQGGLGATGLTYSAPLFQFANGQGFAGAYRAPQQLANAGTAAFTILQGGVSGSLNLAGTTIPVSRFNIVAGGVAAGPVKGQPESGWWYNPAEPGRLFFVEVQGTSLLIGVFAYDTQSRASWALAQGPISDTGAFTGTLVQCTGGPALGAAFRTPSCTTVLGSLSVGFTSPIAATVALPGASPIPIERLRF